VQGYHYHSPPIQIDWDLSRIAFVAEIVPSRATDSGWFVYSIIPFERAKVYRGNFEYPFAFYDLDGQRNDVPDLLVRAVTSKAYDPYYLSGTAKEPTAMIRYSWKQLNRGGWDYSLNLLGRHSTLQSNVRLDEHLSLEIIPYDDYPTWVLDRTWDAITFVESIEGFPGLEGIHVWSGLNKVRDNYLTGYSDQPPMDEFSSIAQGFRGEYAFGPALSPELYFSPVDRRLHLFGAQGGLWNLDGRNEIVYKGNEDGFINQWLLKDDYGFKERLFVLGNYVVFADGASVEIYEKDVPSALFSAAPPKDQDAWQTLKNELSEHHQPLPPGDLLAMASQFGDPLVTLPSATASSFRSKAGNSRFLLQLETPVSLPGDNILQKDSLDAGKYVVTFEETNRSLTVTQATPPDVSLELTTWENNKDDRSMAIRIRAINTGRQDATELTLTVNAQLNQRREEIHRASVDLFSQGPKMSVIDWLPLEEGEWELKASLVDSQGNTIAQDGDVVYVEEARFPGLNQRFTPARLSLIVLIVLLPAIIAYVVTDELDLTISGRKQNS
jgi:hypothetical protein